jgi:hypothetical protein
MRLNALFIICKEDGVLIGRLHSIDEGRFVFSIKKKYSVADTFTAGFRVNGDFITIETMRKNWERKDEDIIVLMAEIFEIELAEEIKLNNLLNN